MKVVLDLDQLEKEGKISKEERDRFCGIFIKDLGLLVFNLLIGFSVLALSEGLRMLISKPIATLSLGFFLLVLGFLFFRRQQRKLRVFSFLLISIGSILISRGLIQINHANFYPYLLSSFIFFLCAFVFRSSFLAVLGTLALGVFPLDYFDYRLSKIEISNTLYLLLSGSLVLVLFHLGGKKGPGHLRRIVLSTARTSYFLLNLSFSDATRYGDHLSLAGFSILMPPWVFSILWAVILVFVFFWSLRKGDRWLFYLTTLFGAVFFVLHVYEYMAFSPGSLIGVGVLSLAFSFSLAWLMRKRATSV